MEDLSTYSMIAVCAIFVWSGFVRTALGFGGAAVSLPLFLFFVDSPVDILPIIGAHLLVTASFYIAKEYQHIDWRFIGKTLPLIAPFKIIGVLGLLSMPAAVLNVIVYLIILCYAISYITQYNVSIKTKALDGIILALGGYVSGTTLVGAPLIVAVYTKYVAPCALRSTLFVLWFLLVAIKFIGFIFTNTPLHLEWALYMLPFALAGQYIGSIAHAKIIRMGKKIFMRWIGGGLFAICLLGLYRTML